MPQHRGQFLPLSVAQRGLWVSSKLAPAEIVFNIAEALEIHGAIDEAVFSASLLHLANEIEPSRTRIVEEVSGPRQIVSDRFEGRCGVRDMSHAADPFDAAMTMMRAEFSRPINFARDALWASSLLRLGPERYIWYHRCHHVVMDGYSGGLIAQRLAELYNAMLAGAAPPPSGFGRIETLLELEASYRASDRHASDRAYWMEQLADLPEPVSLARRGRHAGTGPLLRQTAHLGEAATRRLATLARESGGSLPQILIALFATYVHRVTGAADLALGMPVTGRVGRELRRIPAMVANAVVMRFRFTPQMTLADLIAQSARNMRGALRHQQFRYEDLRRALGLFHTDQQISWTGINIEPFDFDLRFGGHPSTAHNLSNGPVEDLTVFIYDRNDGRGLRIDFDANALLYEAAELQRHADRLLRLIDAIVAEPDAKLAGFPLFADGERALVLSLAGRRLEGPIADPVALLETMARARPDATAVRGEDGFLTYEALASEVRRIARALGDAGIGQGHIVAIAPDRQAEMVAIVLGVMAAGAAFLPLDPDGPPERAAIILEDAQPAAMIASAATAALLGFDPGGLHPGSGSRSLPGAPPGAGLHVRAGGMRTQVPPGTAYVIYTSGSTGKPKGVVVPRTALANLLAGVNDVLAFAARDRLLAVTTLGFDIAILELLLPLRNGGQVVIATRKQVLDPRALAVLIAEAGITAMQATPSLWSIILAGGQIDALRGLTIMTGGEALPAHLARRLQPVASRLVNLYGPTETTIWSTIQVVGADDVDAPSIGRPLPNQCVYVRDADGNPAPIDVVGELCIGGDGVSSGYLNRDELTAEKFQPDPFAGTTGARLYRTGDRASVRPDGRIDYLGRADDQMKVRGVRIEPGETEAALLAVPGVAQAAVVLRQDGADVRLCGYLIADAGITLDPEDLRRSLARLVPEAAIPTAWAVLEQFPLNANGKLDRRALPAPEHAKRAGYVAPRTPDETMLAEIWGELFGLDKIGVHDNFFALGGDSLIAAQLIAELSARHGADLPLGAMFEDATLESLAGQLAQARTGEGERRDPLAELLPIRARGSDPGLFCIHPVSGLAWGYAGLLRYIGQNHPIHGLQSFSAERAATLGDLARRYIGLIRGVQAHGPYNLLGFSFGGLVAHEMARQLEAIGERITFLGLLDAYPYRSATAAGDDSVGPETIMQEEEGEFVRAALGFLGLHQDALGHEAGIDDLVDHLAGVYDLAGRPTPEEVGNPAELVARLREVTEANLALARAHKPGVVAADVLFVRATERNDGAATLYLHDRPEAWRPFLAGRLERREVACGHQDMLDGPAMESVGPWVATWLDARSV